MIERALDADKAEDIETIDLRGQSTIADYMIVASGRSTTQVTAMAKKLQERLKVRGMAHTSIEGTEHGNWVILDAGDVIVHLFRPEVRSFYKIEDMWQTPHHHANGKNRHVVQQTAP
ncbi:MAG: ribosome silencing factor [Proteobacteria bacterium]|nr:ribosome silencing factor [Pseudomonadota bacterium]